MYKKHFKSHKPIENSRIGDNVHLWWFRGWREWGRITLWKLLAYACIHASSLPGQQRGEVAHSSLASWLTACFGISQQEKEVLLASSVPLLMRNWGWMAICSSGPFLSGCALKWMRETSQMLWFDSLLIGCFPWVWLWFPQFSSLSFLSTYADQKESKALLKTWHSESLEFWRYKESVSPVSE